MSNKFTEYKPVGLLTRDELLTQAKEKRDNNQYLTGTELQAIIHEKESRRGQPEQPEQPEQTKTDVILSKALSNDIVKIHLVAKNVNNNMSKAEKLENEIDIELASLDKTSGNYIGDLDKISKKMDLVVHMRQSFTDVLNSAIAEIGIQNL